MRSAVVARVGRTRYAIDVEHVVEVTRLPAWSTPAVRRPNVLGLIDLRGTSVPLLDLEGHLTGTPRTFRDGDVVALGREVAVVAVVVDEVLGLSDIDPDPAAEGAVRGDDGQLLVVLDDGPLYAAAGCTSPWSARADAAGGAAS